MTSKQFEEWKIENGRRADEKEFKEQEKKRKNN